MLLQTSLATRRQFLERSMLGFGSAFLLPSLLASCTDHRIPDPRTPATSPLLGDYQIDWNDAAKSVVTTGLGMIPEAGEILSLLTDIFWPSSQEDVWGEIKDQVEALVDQKIGDFEYELVYEDLQGLNNLLGLYLNALKNSTAPEILTTWLQARGAFVQALPHFQSKEYELPLLPLFGQFAGMYLSLLRDGAQHGLSWGMTPADETQIANDLTRDITNFTNYTNNTYYGGRNALTAKTSVDFHLNEPFNTVNKYDRQMAFTVLYFMDAWTYYDVNTYPNGGATVVYTREVYTDPVGTSDENQSSIVMPSPSPQQRPTKLEIWDDDRVVGAQVTYPANSGPRGVTQTGRMGYPSGGNDHELDVSVSNPIIQTRTTYGDIVNQVQFRYNDGTLTPTYGATVGGNDTGWLGFINMALSSVYIHGQSSFYKSANTVVFGFQYWKNPQETLNALQAIYIKSPKEHSVADFANAFPTLAIGANFITNELKDARKAYWERIKARANKPK